MLTHDTTSGGHRVVCDGHVTFESLTQYATLKPTHLVALHDQASPAWWREAAGTPRSDYFEKFNLRPMVGYLRTDCPAATLRPGEPVTVDLRISTGQLPSSRPEVIRYGGQDVLLVRRGLEEIGRWETIWFWLDFPADGGMPGFLTTPPPDLEAAAGEIPRMPRRPDVEEGGLTETFTWSPRETDLNNHVFFVSYIERIENAYATAYPGQRQPAHCEVWYLGPSFLGEQMNLVSHADADGWVAQIRRASDGSVCAVARLS